MYSDQVRALSSRLTEVERGFPDYWTFDGRDRREGAHGMFHYPAMMVPQMQGAVLDLLREVTPSIKQILDPFVGSGTTLVEAMVRGLDFSGLDINPLAVLISKAKAKIISPTELAGAAERISSKIKSDRQVTYFTSFENQKKWFSKSASIGLSRIARAIEAELNSDVRRVFWVVLARIVRSTCNSRSSTYKLHIKADAVQSLAPIDAEAQFDRHSAIVLNAFKAHYELLKESESLSNGVYKGEISLRVGDLLQGVDANERKADVVITSPPYGDNRTTIPYGQYSYLPLRWIPIGDIAEGLDDSFLVNTHSTDTASLGGSNRKAITRGFESCGQYETYQEVVRALKGNDSGIKRFASFAADLKQSVEILTAKTKLGGFHVWTVGERRIGDSLIPMAKLLEEMLSAQGIHLVHAATRRILSKRMAARNTMSKTMDSEQILIACRLN